MKNKTLILVISKVAFELLILEHFFKKKLNLLKNLKKEKHTTYTNNNLYQLFFWNRRQKWATWRKKKKLNQKQIPLLKQQRTWLREVLTAILLLLNTILYKQHDDEKWSQLCRRRLRRFNCYYIVHRHTHVPINMGHAHHCPPCPASLPFSSTKKIQTSSYHWKKVP